MNPPSNGDLRAGCEVRLNELEQSDIADLTHFAECRLASLGLPPSAGEDVTQRALLAILRGLESDQGGRMPRRENIEHKEAFLNWLRGAISSIIEAMGRKREFRNPHAEWDDNDGRSNIALDKTPSSQAELNDLATQLFDRLRQRTPKRLHPTIAAWEHVFDQSDRIPDVKGRRKYVHQIRYLARDIVSELGGIR
jgi:hypothetical protein